MANDKNGNPINVNNLITTVRPTQLGKKQADLTLDVRKAAAGLFRMEGGEVKVPRKRATSDKWPDWFESLEAPAVVYIWTDGQTQKTVQWDEEAQLFHDEDGNQYTGDNVVEAASPDGREVEGTTEALQQLRNAITRFNGKTGKKLATRFVKAQRDASGRTIRQTEMVYRIR